MRKFGRNATRWKLADLDAGHEISQMGQTSKKICQRTIIANDSFYNMKLAVQKGYFICMGRTSDGVI